MMTLSKEQQEAVALAKTSKLCVVTGGPGTGKTTTLKAIVEAMGPAAIALCAPTGKAAKRMREQTDRAAFTIHRLLAMKGGKKDEDIDLGEKPSDALQIADLVIVDESSMVDTELFARLFSSIGERTRVVLVGDVNQLPPVGSGQVFRDLLQSGVVPTVKLSRVYRQGPGSGIAENAERMLEGQLPVTEGKTDFFFVECENSQEAFERIVHLAVNDIHLTHGIAREDIAVLCPKRSTGDLRSPRFNLVLQDNLNPDKGGYTYAGVYNESEVLRVGDPVRQTKNNYDIPTSTHEKGVFNGEVGRIIEIAEDKAAGKPQDPRDNLVVTVDFGDRIATFRKRAADTLTLAYAITIHSSQGSEYPAVIVPVHSCDSFMLSRPLIYTALTRGKKVVYLVGDKAGLARAVTNNAVTQRRTLLKERLQEALNASAT